MHQGLVPDYTIKLHKTKSKKLSAVFAIHDDRLAILQAMLNEVENDAELYPESEDVILHKGLQQLSRICISPNELAYCAMSIGMLRTYYIAKQCCY